MHYTKTWPVLVAAVLLWGAHSGRCAASDSAAVRFPRSIHAGKLTACERLETPLQWVELDRVLLAGRFEPETDLDAADVTLRAPADGMCYVVVTVMLQDGRSLSRYDYRLRTGAIATPCLALSIAGRPFDVRQWQYSLPGEVRLLFECPLEAERAELEFVFNTGIPQPAVVVMAPTPAAPAAAADAPLAADLGETTGPEQEGQDAEPDKEPAPGITAEAETTPQADAPTAAPGPPPSQPEDEPKAKAKPKPAPKAAPKDDGGFFF